ncbi:hypothetical protein ACTG9Q_13305 [Actinokineospora sp. 24-640]
MNTFQIWKASLALKRVKHRLPKLSTEAHDGFAVATDEARLADTLKEVPMGALRKSGLIMDAYLDTFVAKWLTDAKAHHDSVTVKLDLVAARVAAVVEVCRIRHDDQEDVLHDLEAAVSHALERLADPDTPFYEPVSRAERRKGRR